MNFFFCFLLFTFLLRRIDFDGHWPRATYYQNIINKRMGPNKNPTNMSKLAPQTQKEEKKKKRKTKG